MAIFKDRDPSFNQLSESETAAIVGAAPAATGASLIAFYLVAVAAGVSVWFLTNRVLKGSRR